VHKGFACYKWSSLHGDPNERARQQMTRRLTITQRYATILEVNRAAITQPGINAIFRGTCEAVKKVLTYDRMGLSLYTPETGGLKLAATEGCGPDSFYRVGLMLDGKETHHGWVFQNQKAILRRDLQKEMEFKVEQYNFLEGILSYCAVPLVTRGDSLGVLIILSSQKNRYSQEHAEFQFFGDRGNQQPDSGLVQEIVEDADKVFVVCGRKKPEIVRPTERPHVRT
jgi:transcriptional regulator with GAF, ATPase, and Fis domain